MTNPCDVFSLWLYGLRITSERYIPICESLRNLPFSVFSMIFLLSMINLIFAVREPAKPLNDAQICGAYLFIDIWLQGFLLRKCIPRQVIGYNNCLSLPLGTKWLKNKSFALSLNKKLLPLHPVSG